MRVWQYLLEAFVDLRVAYKYRLVFRTLHRRQWQPAAPAGCCRVNRWWWRRGSRLFSTDPVHAKLPEADEPAIRPTTYFVIYRVTRKQKVIFHVYFNIQEDTLCLSIYIELRVNLIANIATNRLFCKITSKHYNCFIVLFSCANMCHWCKNTMDERNIVTMLCESVFIYHTNYAGTWDWEFQKQLELTLTKYSTV